MRLVNADEIMEKLGIFNDHVNGNEHFLNGIETAREIVENTPTVNPITYAYWVEDPDRERHWHCSNCLRTEGIASVSMNYCPGCGAVMAEHPWLASGCGQTFSPD